MRLFLTGARFSGAEAVDMGLAHRAVPKAELAAAVQAEIDLIRLGGPTAVRECKKLVQQVPALSREDGFELAGRMEPAHVPLRRSRRRHGRLPGKAQAGLGGRGLSRRSVRQVPAWGGGI